MTNVVKCTVVVLIVLATAVPRSAAVARIAIDGRSNAFASVASAGAFVAVAWGATTPGGVTDVYVATSGDRGETFGQPVRVSDGASPANLSGEQPPRIVVSARAGQAPDITVVWTSKAAGGGRLVSTRSTNGGRTFTAPAAVGGSAGVPGNRGWQSIAATADGQTAAIWLDHRDTASGESSTRAGEGHQHGGGTMHGDPTERAQLSKLWFARLGEPAGAHAVAAGVCYCCKTAIAVGPGGAIHAAWRHVYAGSRRDIAFAVSRDNGRTFSNPVRISEDGWQLDGCPENGPAMVVDPQSRIHIVWPTVVSASGRETLALFYSVSSDGRTFRPRQRIPTMASAAYHPQLALERDGRLLLAWDEVKDGVRRVRLARGAIAADGAMVFTGIASQDADQGSYPAVTATDRGSVVVWTTRSSGSVLAVRRLPG